MKPLAILLLSCGPILLADQVVTKDGSRIMGTAISVVDGNLTFKTEFSGKIRIPVDQISSLASESPISLRLDDNRTFNDKIVPADGDRLGLEDNALSFGFARIRHLWADGNEDPLVLAEQKRAEALVMKWAHAIGFDFTGSSGNTDDLGIGLRADSTYGNKFREYELYLAYNNSSKKDVTVVDETKLGAEYDSRFFERLSWYAKTDWENDRLEKVDLRATAALGLKYNWITDKSYEVAARAGLAFRFEEYQSPSVDNLSDPALDFGVEYSQEIKDFLSLQSDLTYIPSVKDFTDFLLSNDVALVIPLDKKEDWNLRSGINGTYNSTPVSGKDQLDLKYYLRLVYRLD